MPGKHQAYFTDKPMAILAIRGTQSPADCLTDLRFEVKNVRFFLFFLQRQRCAEHVLVFMPPGDLM
jgi:hypothetical protein